MEKAMANTLDLAAYLDRVNWSGPTEHTYATLSGLLEAHIAHIPFENFDVLLGRPVRLDVEGLQSKLVMSRRGGYCFEHATLFAAVLERLGFEPVRHDARVTVFQPPSEVARTHMFLTVDLDGACFVIDPGFGPFGSNLPVPLDGTGVPVGRSTHRMVREGDLWVMHGTRDGAYIPAWVSTLESQYPVDFEMANHFIATHSSSRFVNGILASAVTAEGRVNVMNRDVTVVRRGTVEKSTLPDRAALRLLLVEHFGFDRPEAETMRVPSVPDWR
jgi:N-hydroxyarylamine O-acetyltransferase